MLFIIFPNIENIKIFVILPFRERQREREGERFLKFYHLPITIYHLPISIYPYPKQKKNFHKKTSKFNFIISKATNKMSFIIFPNIENIKKLIRCRLSFFRNIENF